MNNNKQQTTNMEFVLRRFLPVDQGEELALGGALGAGVVERVVLVVVVVLLLLLLIIIIIIVISILLQIIIIMV